MDKLESLQTPEMEKIPIPQAIKVPKIEMGQKKPEEKIKVLAYCDSPTVSTGFGIVARNILRRLHDTGKFEITILGINHHGEPYDHEKFPYDIFPSTLPIAGSPPDMYGSKMFIEMVNSPMPFDILFTLQDPFILNKVSQYIKKAQEKKKFKWICYMPLDAEKPQIDWLEPFIVADYPIAYNDWAKEKWTETAQNYKWEKKKEPNKEMQKIIKQIYELPNKYKLFIMA